MIKRITSSKGLNINGVIINISRDVPTGAVDLRERPNRRDCFYSREMGREMEWGTEYKNERSNTGQDTFTA